MVTHINLSQHLYLLFDTLSQNKGKNKNKTAYTQKAKFYRLFLHHSEREW